MPVTLFGRPFRAHRAEAPLEGLLHRPYNPLVRVVLAVAGLLAVSLSRDLAQLVGVAAVFLVLCKFLGLHLVHLARNVRVILPWTIIFFAIHLIFSLVNQPQAGLAGLIREESIILFRFLGLAGVMGVLREGMSAQALVDSFKSLMDRLHIRSRIGEDLLQTLRLILVFIPQVMREYQSLERFNRALGFAPPNTIREKVRFYGGNLLPVMSRSLTRAHQLGTVMVVRGYGRVIPRGQLTPIPFGSRDGLAAAAVVVFLGGVGWVL